MPPKPRILFIIESLSYGGVERRRLSLVKYLKGRFEFRVVCAKASGGLVDDFKKEEVVIYEVGVLGKLWNWKVYKNTIQAIRDFKPDIVHGAVFEGVTLANICGALTRAPIIISEETSDPQNRSKKAHFLLRMFLRKSDKVIGVSGAVCEYLKNKVKVPIDKIVPINNGVAEPADVDQEVVNGLKRKCGVSPDDFVIGSVGRLKDDTKKFSDLIKAMENVVKHIPNVKLIIVGGGNDELYLKSLAAQLNIVDKVIITGYVDNPHPYYQMMHLFCLASSNESFGLVLVEAMFHRLPVIATSVGGMKEIVLNDETGILIPPHSPDAIAKAIHRLYTNQELRETMGGAGFKRAMENYEARPYAKKVGDLYMSLLKTKNIL